MRQYTQVQHSEAQPRAGGVLARTVGLLILATLTALSGCSMNPAIKESRELAAAGRSIVFVSSYLPELLGVCDTIAVMCRGRITDVKPVADWTEHSIISAAIGQTS